MVAVCNYLNVNGLGEVQYVDETLYIPVRAAPQAESGATTIQLHNNKLVQCRQHCLYCDNTPTVNVCFPTKLEADDHIVSSRLFEGVAAEKMRNFSFHVDCIVRKCNRRLFLIRQLKTLSRM